MARHLLTSESVSEGHPDKMCDQISDAVLDACLKEDPDSHVACECFITTGLVVVGGELKTEAYVDVQKLARKVVEEIGYSDAEHGLDYRAMGVVNLIQEQSLEIDEGVRRNFKESGLGAGDQGMAFGFASDETRECMPAPIMLAHKILQKASGARRDGLLDWLRPDAKSQVTIEYEDKKPKRVHTVVLSHQHAPNIKQDDLRECLINEIIKPVLLENNFGDDDIIYYINPAGTFTKGGPSADTGLTGRKIIVDTYGGAGRHGGGSFSGKDGTKVDRSGAYMARNIAKAIVESGYARRCEVEIAYAIGRARPVSLMIDTMGTGSQADSALADFILENVDMSPSGIISLFGLTQPCFRATATYGHFGRDNFAWEDTKVVRGILAGM